MTLVKRSLVFRFLLSILSIVIISTTVHAGSSCARARDNRTKHVSKIGKPKEAIWSGHPETKKNINSLRLKESTSYSPRKTKKLHKKDFFKTSKVKNTFPKAQNKKNKKESNIIGSVKKVNTWSTLGATRIPGLRSNAALLIDMRNGKSVYQKNATQVVPIASITKLMTAMVMLDANLPMNEELMITDHDVDTIKGSRSRLTIGTRLTRREALLLSLMSSENRAAHALGRNYPGGISAFVIAMNRKARTLGMLNSNFTDPTGLSASNVSTAEDLAKMVTAAYYYPEIRETSTTSNARVTVLGRMQEYRNTNPLVRSESWNIGVTKTGFIREAGKCLVMQATVNQRPMVFVLLDSEGSLARVGDANRLKRWVEAQNS